MNSSAVPLKSTDVQDIQQRQVNSAAGIVEEAATLHPAAAVFRDEILGNVRESSKTLETSNARFRHITGLVQEVKLACHTVSYRRGEEERGEEVNVIHVDRHQTFTVKQKLSRDSTALDGEERLVLPIEDAPAQPVEDCGVIGCIEFVGGVTFGSYPESCFYVNDAAKVVIDEDCSVRLILRLSEEVVVEGRLHSSQMTNAALIEHIQQFPNFMAFLNSPVGVGPPMGSFHVMGSGEYRKGILFTPLSISIKVTPWLKETLALVDQVSSTGGSEADVELESEDGLRRLVVEALGDSEHKEIFHEYLALKQESSVLTKLRSLMLSVNVSHSRGSFTVTLDEGTRSRSANSWYINVDVGDRSMIPVSELHRMQVTVLGMQLRLLNGLSLTHVSSLFDRNTGGWALWPVQFQAGSTHLKFYLIVMFNWDELMEEDIEGILDNFSSKMMNALGFQENNPGNHDDAFPETFEANVVAIGCDISLAEAMKGMNGLWGQK
jgi:hypothetical protein